jgi:hypothetical protein
VTGPTVNPPVSEGGNGSSALPSVVVTPPDASGSDTLTYEVPEKAIANALPRAEAEGDNILRIKLDVSGGYVKYIINMPAAAVRDALQKYVFSTELETPLGTVSFDNGQAARNMTAESKFVVCTVTEDAKTVTVDGVPFKAEEPAKPKDFADLPPTHWAYEYVMALAGRGVLSGISETEFAPDAEVTREQFARMLTLALGIYDETTVCDFPDLPESHWAYASVASAVRAGVILGYGDGSFGTGRNISRQEMAAMVSRANLSLPETWPAADFTDSDQIADWAKEAVTKMQRANMINGFEDGSFRPNDNATRAQAAKIIHGLLGL